jgi:hypothetical protein
MIFYFQFLLFQEKLLITLPTSLYDLWYGSLHIRNYQTIDSKDWQHYPFFFYSNLIYIYFGCLAHLRLYSRFNRWDLESKAKSEKWNEGENEDNTTIDGQSTKEVVEASVAEKKEQ